MDDKQKSFNENSKKEIEKILAQKILTALDTKQIDLTQMKIIANHILDTIDKVKDDKDLMLFLSDLKTKWQFFSDVANLYNKQNYQEKEKIVLDKLSNYIRKNN